MTAIEFEERLGELISEAVKADLTNDEIVSAMELRIMELEEGSDE